MQLRQPKQLPCPRAISNNGFKGRMISARMVQTLVFFFKS